MIMMIILQISLKILLSMFFQAVHLSAANRIIFNCHIYTLAFVT